MSKKITQQDLNKILWQAADSSRSSVDAGVYKDYVLTMLFFKYVSDLSKKKRAQHAERFGTDTKRIEEKMKLDRFYVPEDATFDAIYEQIESDNIGEEINKALQRMKPGILYSTGMAAG